MAISNARSDKESFHWQHLLAWIGGILCAMVPFLGFWEISSIQIPVRFGPGNFGFNILIVTGLCTLGGIIGGYWWKLNKWLIGEKDWPLTGVTLLLCALGGWTIFSSQSQDYFFHCVSGVLGLGFVLSLIFRDKAQKNEKRRGFVAWLKGKNPLNAVFFILLFFILAASNIVSLVGLDISLMEKASAMLGRLFVCGALAGVLYLLTELTMRAAPKYFRWVPWLALSMAPLVVAADQWMGIALNRRLIEFVNGLTASGDFDPVVELAASGLDVGPVGALLLVIGVFVFAMFVAWGAWGLSKRLNMKVSVLTAVLITLGCWLGVVAEQGIGMHWKSQASWQAEQKLFAINPGIFTPPKGVGHYAVSFFEPELGLENTAVSNVTTKPDIYVFMLESVRQDAVSEKTSPFFWKMQNEECQPFEKTWSTSNATHLSWFGFFHSQVPVFWRGTLEGIEGKETYMGSPALQWMKKSGYDIQVRAVCDLGYKDFGMLNFGGGKSLVSVWDDTQSGMNFYEGNIPEREVVTFHNLREAVKNSDEGGSFYFTGLDSPHYNYYWHRDFQPPHDDYEENIRFPFNPSPEEIMRYKRRYWNSVAWVDHQIAEFCDFLKKEGRYDNAVIIITGDHGEEFQEQGSWCHCSSLEPEQIQVPLLIKWPKSMGRGDAISEVSHLDVMPSLLDMLGAAPETSAKMAGKSLLKKEEFHTVIAATAYAGQTGETLILRRDGYRATFSWPQYWDARVPESMVLERSEGPDGKIILADPAAYAEELKRLFPDAFTRFFDKFEVIED